MKYYKTVFLILGITAVFGACLQPYNGKNENETGLPGNGMVEINSELFVPIPGEDGYRFYTNDPKYRTSSGHTLWAYNTEPEQIFTERTIKMYKTQGDNIAGFGAIICSSQCVVNGHPETVFLTVMINNSGQYAVGKVINASYTSLVNWTNNSGIIKYYSGFNKVKIVKAGNVYSLYFNSNPVPDTFVDSQAPICNDYGRNGYIVVISPTDLNGSAVDVWFYED
jgi:hypothetical protein